MTAHFKHNNYTTTITGEPNLVKEWIDSTIKKYKLKKVSNGVQEETWTNGVDELVVNL